MTTDRYINLNIFGKELNKDLKHLFEIAEITKMDRKELAVYQESLKDYWDLKNAMDMYFGKGKIEEQTKIAINLINMRMNISQIA